MPTFDTPAPILARVDIILGDIRFVAGDRVDTVVEVHPIDPSRKLDIEAAEQVTVELAGGKLLVKQPHTRLTTKYGSVKVLIELPTGSDVRGETAEGEYVVQGALRSCRLTNAIGDIRLVQATDVRLRTTGGKVIVDHVTGQADISASGDIRVRRIDGGAVVKTTGGDIRIGEFAGGTADLYAAIGNIEVGVSGGIAVRLDAHTLTGRVRNYLAGPDANDRSDRTAEVHARCNTGDIIVHRSRTDHDARDAGLSGRG